MLTNAIIVQTLPFIFTFSLINELIIHIVIDILGLLTLERNAVKGCAVCYPIRVKPLTYKKLILKSLINKYIRIYLYTFRRYPALTHNKKIIPLGYRTFAFLLLTFYF